MRKDFSFGLIPMYQYGEQLLFLLLQHLEGHWAFPKGHPEEDESSLETAQREFEEETGIVLYSVDENQIFSEEYYPQVNGEILHKTVKYYLAKVSERKVTPQAEEVKDYAWLSYRDALERITFAPSKKILKEAWKYLAR
jgi:bis(5'-nucleosidyl)-tetraphosphatase